MNYLRLKSSKGELNIKLLVICKMKLAISILFLVCLWDATQGKPEHQHEHHIFGNVSSHHHRHHHDKDKHHPHHDPHHKEHHQEDEEEEVIVTVRSAQLRAPVTFNCVPKSFSLTGASYTINQDLTMTVLFQLKKADSITLPENVLFTEYVQGCLKHVLAKAITDNGKLAITFG